MAYLSAIQRDELQQLEEQKSKQFLARSLKHETKNNVAQAERRPATADRLNLRPYSAPLSSSARPNMANRLLPDLAKSGTHTSWDSGTTESIYRPTHLQRRMQITKGPNVKNNYLPPPPPTQLMIS